MPEAPDIMSMHVSATHKIQLDAGIGRIHMDWLSKFYKGQPNKLFHYTNAHGFHGIMDSGEIFATHISYLNDSSEYVHLIDIMRRAIDLLKTDTPDIHQTEPIRTVVNYLDSFSSEHIPQVYVTCFSSEENDLGQWRAYSGGEGGVALGFRPENLIVAAGIKGANLYQVVYDDNLKIQLVMSILRFGMQEYKRVAEDVESARKTEYLDQWLIEFVYWVAMLAPTLKHQAFQQEKEWRLITRADYKTKIELVPTSAGFKLRIRLPLRAAMEHPIDTRMPVSEVWIGPSPNTQLINQALDLYLKRKGMTGVEIKRALIPLRMNI